ncbi:MAG TPA: sigma-70 family RNA polymerase sigma factor [Thermoanaerobaculia bacterium]|nr:sigma-70 family RNA polymerase sigma factor [Thermoanaerobaculia bacterium]
MSRILVVDDEPVIVEAIQGLLELNDFSSEAACDVDRAEELISTEFFPVILADLRLRSEEEGFRLLEAVRRLSPSSRVATMTGYADAATEARLRELGSHLVLRKPLGEDELMRALRDMLGAIAAAEAAHAGDDEELYASTQATLYAIARGRFGFPLEDAEELVQETWVLYLDKRRDIRTPRTWLSGTIANLCRQEIERRMKDRARTATSPVPHERPALRTDDSVLAVRQALAKLDDRSRMLCNLIGLEQHSYDEVSAAANIPLGSVGPLYMRAKERLRKAL